jgi:uncharacterized protein YoxC
MFLLEASIAVLAISVIVICLTLIKLTNWIKNLEWCIQQELRISRGKVIDMEEK